MEYRGFECYATAVPEELSENGAGKVFACEIYAAWDNRLANVLSVFDLVEGKDVSVGSEEELVSALRRYVDEHYDKLLTAVFQSGKSSDAIIHDILQTIESARITETANAVLGFDFLYGQKVVFVDFCYDASEDLPTCDVVNLLTLPLSEEYIALAHGVLNGVADCWKVPVHVDSLIDSEISGDFKSDVFKVYEELTKLQENPGYHIAATMAYLNEHCEPDKPLTDDELYVLAEKFVEASGSWFETTASKQEYLIAFGDLLECGITTHNNPDFSELGPMETRKLLLEADERVFGTLVESAAVENCYRYLPNDYNLSDEDLNVVERSIEGVLFGSVMELIDDAQRSCAVQGEKIKGEVERECILE